MTGIVATSDGFETHGEVMLTLATRAPVATSCIEALHHTVRRGYPATRYPPAPLVLDAEVGAARPLRLLPSGALTHASSRNDNSPETSGEQTEIDSLE